MKISKVFGFVLGLHLVVIAALVVQPGCGTTQPPSLYNYRQGGYERPIASKPSDKFISNGRMDVPLDPAFNNGLKDVERKRYTLNPAEEEFTEFDEITPKLTPVLTPKLTPVIQEPVNTEIEVTGTSFKTHTVQKGDNLWAISKRYDCALNELYAANGLNKNSVLKIGQQIQVPVEGGTGTLKTITADAYQPSDFKVATKSYIVKGGDNLSRIALRYDTTVSAIKAANNKTSDMIRVGEKLLIPTSSETSTVSQSYNNSVGFVPAANKNSGVHVVKVGEYPATIARQYGITTAELLTINNISDPRKMQVGQRLKIRSTSGVVNKPQPETKIVPMLPVIEPVEIDQPTGRSIDQPIDQPKAITAVKENKEPVEIRVVEADPLIESEEDFDIESDAIFEDAIEIPVIRIEE